MYRPNTAVAQPGSARRQGAARKQGWARKQSEQGLVALEWLLIVGAIAGLAASSVLVVQRVLDDTTDVPDDPLVRMLEADIAAAYVASEAQAISNANPSANFDIAHPEFKSRCEDIADAFNDVVEAASTPPKWVTPDGIDPDNEVRARCVLTPKRGLGG